MEQKKLDKKAITVQAIDTKTGTTKDGKPWTRLTITDQDGDKYTVWKDKKDGTETKAFLAIKTGEVALFNKVIVSFDAEEREFTDKQGQPRKYTQRRVAWFSPVDEAEQPEEVNPDDVPF